MTGKPAAAALARMSWTVGPASLHALAHKRDGGLHGAGKAMARAQRW